MRAAPSRAGRRLALAIASGLVAACGGLFVSEQPPDRVYWLEPLAAGDVPASQPLRSLRVRAAAAPGMDTERILTLDDDAFRSPNHRTPLEP